MSNTIGIYVHIPFCKSKCPYCDFFSANLNESDYDIYCNELKHKLKYWGGKTNKEVATVYFGGGTPSVLGAKRLCSLLESVKSNFKIINNPEITVEVNPDTGKYLDFCALYNTGFNRISIGMQSAVESELRALGRIHSADDAKQTVINAQNAGINNISLDLMMGIPNQTIDTLENSIKFCADCKVTHISSYILKIEEKTPFYKLKNTLNLADEDMQAEMYLQSVSLLEKLGYKQYEISNFALKGFESKHNINYWQCGEYIGIGPSAHSFLDGKRFYYDRNMNNFVDNIINSDGYGGDEDEYIMLSLRLKRGLVFNDYFKKFGKEISVNTINKAKRLAENKYLEIDNEHICLTPKGFLVSNAIICELIK